MCAVEFPLQPTRQALLLRWKTLHPRRRGILHLGDAYEAFARPFSIGSGPEARLRIEHETLAPIHLELVYHASSPVLRALSGPVRVFDEDGNRTSHFLIGDQLDAGLLAGVQRINASNALDGETAHREGLNIEQGSLPAGGAKMFHWRIGRGLQYADAVSSPELGVGCYAFTFEVPGEGARRFCASEPPAGAVEEARAPESPPDRLAQLAGHRDFRVRREVARNPNAPPAALAALLEEFPDEFFANPALGLLLLEDVGFFRRLTPGALRSLVESEAPEWFAGLLASEALPMPEEFSYRRDARPASELAAGYRRASPGLLYALTRSPRPETRRALLSNPATPREAFLRLAEDGDPLIRAAAAAALAGA
jgi:hypothetical protein